MDNPALCANVKQIKSRCTVEFFQTSDHYNFQHLISSSAIDTSHEDPIIIFNAKLPTDRQTEKKREKCYVAPGRGIYVNTNQPTSAR